MPEVLTRLPVGASPIISPRCTAHADTGGYLVPFGDQILDLEAKIRESPAHQGQESLGHLDALTILSSRQLLVLDVAGADQIVSMVEVAGVDDLLKELADDALVLFVHEETSSTDCQLAA